MAAIKYVLELNDEQVKTCKKHPHCTQFYLMYNTSNIDSPENFNERMNYFTYFSKVKIEKQDISIGGKIDSDSFPTYEDVYNDYMSFPIRTQTLNLSLYKNQLISEFVDIYRFIKTIPEGKRNIVYYNPGEMFKYIVMLKQLFPNISWYLINSKSLSNKLVMPGIYEGNIIPFEINDETHLIDFANNGQETFIANNYNSALLTLKPNQAGEFLEGNILLPIYNEGMFKIITVKKSKILYPSYEHVIYQFNAKFRPMLYNKEAKPEFEHLDGCYDCSMLYNIVSSFDDLIKMEFKNLKNMANFNKSIISKLIFNGTEDYEDIIDDDYSMEKIFNGYSAQLRDAWVVYRPNIRHMIPMEILDNFVNVLFTMVKSAKILDLYAYNGLLTYAFLKKYDNVMSVTSTVEECKFVKDNLDNAVVAKTLNIHSPVDILFVEDPLSVKYDQKDIIIANLYNTTNQVNIHKQLLLTIKPICRYLVIICNKTYEHTLVKGELVFNFSLPIKDPKYKFLIYS